MNFSHHFYTLLQQVIYFFISISVFSAMQFSSMSSSSSDSENQLNETELYFKMSQEQKKISLSSWRQEYHKIRIHQSQDQLIKDITRITTIDQHNHIWMMFDMTPFINLQQIWMNRNQILSLQPLQQMQMNKIKVLSFSYNNIASVRPIRRMFLPNITQIQLDHNLIIEGASISEMKMNKNLLFWLYFSQNSIEKETINRNLNAKIYPIVLKK